jgi:hypothetical protein
MHIERHWILAGSGGSSESRGSAYPAGAGSVASAWPGVSGSPAARVVANSSYDFQPTPMFLGKAS